MNDKHIYKDLRQSYSIGYLSKAFDAIHDALLSRELSPRDQKAVKRCLDVIDKVTIKMERIRKLQIGGH